MTQSGIQDDGDERCGPFSFGRVQEGLGFLQCESRPFARAALRGPCAHCRVTRQQSKAYSIRQSRPQHTVGVGCLRRTGRILGRSQPILPSLYRGGGEVLQHGFSQERNDHLIGKAPVVVQRACLAVFRRLSAKPFLKVGSEGLPRGRDMCCLLRFRCGQQAPSGGPRFGLSITGGAPVYPASAA